MDVEEYAEQVQLLYTGEASRLLRGLLDRLTWNNYLDLGCGDGSLLYALERRGYFKGKVVQAIDLSKTRMRRVNRLNPLLGGLVADCCSLPIQSAANIDILVSSHVIEHVSDDEEMIKEVSRILKKGSVFYLATPFKGRFGWFYHRRKGEWVLDPTHIREYTSERQLVDLLKKHDFEVLVNKKSLLRFSILDFLLKRLLVSDPHIYDNRLFEVLRNIKVLWPGYYHWELVLERR